jgi:lauroyl/myristoyl acyltransferase
MPLDALKWLRVAKRRVSAAGWPVIDELLRSFLMVLILRPAAHVLPRKRALTIARLCGSVMLRVPSSGGPALATMRKAFLMEGEEARSSAREYLAQPFCSFVIFDRLLRGRENLDSWTVEERNNQDVVQLRESGRSFIVAAGHFRRESYIAICIPRFCPGSIATVSIPLPGWSLHPHNIRTKVQFGQFLKVHQRVRPDHEFVYVGGALKKLLKHLAQPGCQVVMSVDAFWKTASWSAHTRPFAGMRARPFSIGSAVLGRLAQCPIATLASYVAKDGTVVLEWGPVISPPQREDEGADVSNTNMILDFLEGAIGRRPSQYTLYIGEERRWDSVLQTWEDPDCKESPTLGTTREAGIYRK